MIIDYSVQTTFTQSLVVNDIGNCAIICHGTCGFGETASEADYYILINTIMGRTTIFKWGPMEPDFEELPSGFNLSIKSIKYKESSITKEITLFINAPEKGIYEAEVIEKDEAFKALPKTENFDATLA